VETKDLPVVYVEGLIAHDKVDPDGDQFDLDGVTYDGYLEDGYVANRCDVRPKIQELVGEPVSIRRTEDGLLMRAKIFHQSMVSQLQALDDAGLDPGMGFALAGVITEKEDLPGGRMAIKKCRIRSVGLIQAANLSDPACKVSIVKPSEDDKNGYLHWGDNSKCGGCGKKGLTMTHRSQDTTLCVECLEARGLPCPPEHPGWPELGRRW
jgi:hypothetical protein